MSHFILLTFFSFFSAFGAEVHETPLTNSQAALVESITTIMIETGLDYHTIFQQIRVPDPLQKIILTVYTARAMQAIDLKIESLHRHIITVLDLAQQYNIPEFKSLPFESLPEFQETYQGCKHKIRPQHHIAIDSYIDCKQRTLDALAQLSACSHPEFFSLTLVLNDNSFKNVIFLQEVEHYAENKGVSWIRADLENRPYEPVTPQTSTTKYDQVYAQETMDLRILSVTADVTTALKSHEDPTMKCERLSAPLNRFLRTFYPYVDCGTAAKIISVDASDVEFFVSDKSLQTHKAQPLPPTVVAPKTLSKLKEAAKKFEQQKGTPTQAFRKNFKNLLILQTTHVDI